MKISTLLTELREASIFVSSDGEKLNVKSSVTPVPEEIMNKLVEHKDALIQFLVLSESKNKPGLAAAKDKTKGLEASSEQKTLWPIFEGREYAASYNVNVNYQLSDNLDTARLKQAIEQEYKSNDVLHSLFSGEGEQVKMYLALDSEWQVEEFSIPQNELDSWIEHEKNRIFDLRRGPLFIARLLNINERFSVLQMNFPHIIIDGWSVDLLLKNIFRRYQGEDLEADDFDFLDFLAMPKNSNRDKEYWLDRLSEYRAPLIHSVSPPLGSAVHVLNKQISKESDSEFLSQAVKQGVSEFSSALYLFGQVISKYTGQNDVLVTIPYANREQSYLHKLLGYFVSMIPIRFDYGNQGRNVVQFHQQCRLDMSHADADFGELLPILGLQSDSYRNPLHQVIFSWHDTRNSGINEISDVVISDMPTVSAKPKFPLMLTVFARQSVYDFKWEFDPSLISLDSIEILHENLTKLWSAKRLEYQPSTVNEPEPPTESLICAFAQQVADYPEKVAIYEGDSCSTYLDLNQKSNSVAKLLHSRGVAVGEKVGLMLPTGIRFAYALLGILKAGGVYVPLSDRASSKNLHEIVKQTGMRFCITGNDSRIDGVECLSLTSLTSVTAEEFTPPVLSGSDGAYVNFSSGTTGDAKGIECLHQGVLRLVRQPNFMTLSANTIMLCAAPATFDAFTLEFWAPLLNGGSVCFNETDELNARQLVLIISERGVNSMWLTAALFNTIVDISPQAFTGLDQLLIGGDVVSPFHVNQVYQKVPDLTIINGYGPTENTTFTSCFQIPRSWPEDITLPIGKPVNGTSVYILNESQENQPTGFAGEIVVAGLGLAKGYLVASQNRNAFANLDIDGQAVRVYKTGDIGFIDLNGNLNFLGRRDDQVKINGFRVELEAINMCLRSISGVTHVETIALKDTSSQELVSFVKFDGNSKISIETLFNQACQDLPSYMVPNTIFPIESIPLTANGKLNRRVLEDLFIASRRDTGKHERQLTKTEQLVSKVWHKNLGCSALSPSANFYRLGGNSLLLLKVQADLEDVTGKQISLASLTKSPYLSAHASAVDRLADEDNAELSSSFELDNQTRIPLTHEQLRIWLSHQQFENTAYNIPILVGLPDGVSDEDAQTATRAILQAHSMLRMRVVEDEDGVSQEPLDLSSYRFKVEAVTQTDLEARLQQARDRIFILDEKTSSVSIFRTGKDKVLLLLNIHHICFDGESIPILLDSLGAALQGKALQQDRGFERFALYQMTDEFKSLKIRSIEYWNERHRDSLSNTQVPQDLVRKKNHKAVHASADISQGIRRDSVALCQRLGATEFNFWLSVFSLVLGRINDCVDVTIAVPFANRMKTEHQNSIGFFANTLMLRLAWDENYTFSDYLSLVQQQISDDMCHQQSGLDEISSGNSESSVAGPEVMFSLSSEPDSAFQGGPSIIEIRKNSDAKFKFSFSVFLSESHSRFNVEYRESDYSGELIQSFMQTINMLLGQVVSQPEIIVGDIVLGRIYRGKQDLFKKDQSIVDVIKHKASANPDAIAIRTHSQLLSYGELFDRSARIATALINAGVRPQDRVAVLMERDINLPIVLLSILSVGAVYVALDLSYPHERTNYIIKDSQPSLILVEDIADLQSQHLNCATLKFSECLATEAEPTRLSGVLDLEMIAFIIYTSGSTGLPKGVPIKHLGVVSLYSWAKQIYVEEDFTLVYAGTSICFDLSVFEIFVTWAMEGTVFFAENSLSLIDDSHNHDISLINTVPSILNEVLIYQTLPSALRVLNLAGEPLKQKLVKTIFEKAGNIKLYNLYGPSEDTTYSTYYEINPSLPEKIMIGEPLDSTTAFASDSICRPMPDYFPGELYLSGAGLADGYWNRPDLTNSKFISLGDGVTFYRTGDKVRREFDGNYAYIGRIDNQIKMMGHRIELEEIDQCLISASGVVDSCTIVVEVKGQAALSSFVVKEDDSSCAAETLLSHLRSYLPKWMMPRSIQFIDAIPLTVTGKQDRAELKALDIAQTETKLDTEDASLVWCKVQLERMNLPNDLLPSSIQLVENILKLIANKYLIEITEDEYFSLRNPQELSKIIDLKRGEGELSTRDMGPDNQGENDVIFI